MYKNEDAVKLFDQMAAMGDYYSSARPVYVDPQVIVEDICSKIPLKIEDSLLDVGCGTGVVTLPLSRRCREIHAVDPGEKVLEKARARCQEERIRNVTYYQAKALSLPFPDVRFDHVLMYAVIHYLENWSQVERCVTELTRVCRPGGTILIAEIPDEKAKKDFEARQKTAEEERILDRYNAGRTEYDALFKEHVRVRPAGPSTLALDCDRIVDIARVAGCEGRVCRQDIRLPFSLTRRDVVLVKRMP